MNVDLCIYVYMNILLSNIKKNLTNIVFGMVSIGTITNKKKKLFFSIFLSSDHIVSYFQHIKIFLFNLFCYCLQIINLLNNN